MVGQEAAQSLPSITAEGAVSVPNHFDTFEIFLHLSRTMIKGVPKRTGLLFSATFWQCSLSKS
ncbi:hypothetical protein M378DRAFT_155477 [Amanita muscaria Koide BX008]|uniref:Uncharacterized protein n=1 Tax=Amanita muscaria (strain Koide BX008) TaxID=946122 RepID=A0A0C2X882_AMAMK|nr:hypothetical protein M378DRAFT_155477 [Amanita muscaria Koide BX008]